MIIQTTGSDDAGKEVSKQTKPRMKKGNCLPAAEATYQGVHREEDGLATFDHGAVRDLRGVPADSLARREDHVGRGGVALAQEEAEAGTRSHERIGHVQHQP